MLTTAWVLAALTVLVTAASLWNYKVWWVRMFDLPRGQTILLGMLAIVFFISDGAISSATGWAIAFTALAIAYQARKVFPYTFLAPVMARKGPPRDPQRRVSLLVANVLGTNRDARRLLKLIEQYDPDLILTLESDVWWEQALASVQSTRPHAIKIPLDNLYGMHCFSRHPLHDTVVRYLIEEDVPSIRTSIHLPSGDQITFHGLHPRPPAPGENATAIERDAELLIVAREIEKDPGTVIVAGDLNDVAWSTTSDLFRRTSGLLDPRRGRGFYNTFHAKVPFFRWPLDHIFHSADLALLRLERLPAFGSDHYPMFIELEYAPARNNGYEDEAPSTNEREEVDESIEEGREKG
ncbi:MAG: endonuclease/exonuclease/phosphatase family protein [Flavobacteriales bacterium]|nr:endonuclease/exonuclease/phosphatase family protein [Flavobacteriales bacterium]